MKIFWKLDLIGLTTALALPAAAYWTQVAPAIARNQAATAAVHQLEQQRATQTDLEHSLASINAAMKALATTQPGQTLRPLTDLNRRLAELNELAAGYRLTIDSLEPAAAVNHDRYATTEIGLSAQGSYAAAAGWLSELHRSMPDVAVTQWDLSSTTTDKTPQLRITATLRWYALPKPGSK